MTHSEGTLSVGEGKELYYQCWSPDGKARAALVIVHGFGEHGGRYGNVVNTLVPTGWAVYCMDNRGHGKSFGKRGHVMAWDEYLDDLSRFVSLVKEKEPNNPLFILGHSMGGLIAADFVEHKPEGLSGVILSGPALSRGAVSPVLLFAGRVMSAIWPGFTMDTKLDAQAVSRDKAVVETYKNDPLVHSMASARMGTEMGRAIARVLADAGGMSLPVLIVHGGGDRLIPAATSRDLFSRIGSRDKKRLEFPRFFHETHNDVGWHDSVAEMAAWLEGHLPPAGQPA
jgi:alpha-beta hydrolase superfamily lysophospholipase